MEQRQALLTLWRGGQGCLKQEEEKNRIWGGRDEDYLGLAERRDWGEEGIRIYHHLLFFMNYLLGGSRGREGPVCTCSARERIRRSLGNLRLRFFKLVGFYVHDRDPLSTNLVSDFLSLSVFMIMIGIQYPQSRPVIWWPSVPLSQRTPDKANRTCFSRRFTKLSWN